MKFLFIGDIVGRSGRKAVRCHLENNKYDFVVANVENSAAGFGITERVYNDLKSMGINAMTAGNHTWDRKETAELIESWDEFIRPANISSKAAGKGFNIFEVNGKKICVINLLGRVFMNMSNCPFESFDNIYESIDKDCFIIVDFHGEATSEKIAFGNYASNKANVVTGTHTHVQTNDLRLIGNTLYLTDAGMCGAVDSILGMEKESIIEKFVTNMPYRFKAETKGSVLFNGFSFTIDDDNIIREYKLINETFESIES